MHGESGVGCTENGDKMIFPGANASFGFILPMCVGGNVLDMQFASASDVVF